MLAELKHRLDKVKQFAGLIKQLVTSGLNPTAINQLVAAGVEGGLAYAQAIANGGPDAVAQFNDLQTQINEAANGLGTTAAQDMYGAGIQAAQGLINGLQSQRKHLEKWARNLAKSLVSAIKDELKIKSPSRVFKAIGEFTVKGLVQGLSDTRGVTKAMAGVSDAMTVSPSVSTSSAGSGRGDIYLTVNVPVGTDPVATGREVKKALMALPINERRALVNA
jgi:hypothetical protein